MRRLSACLLISLILAIGAGTSTLLAEKSSSTRRHLLSILHEDGIEAAWNQFLAAQESIASYPEDEQLTLLYDGALIAVLSGNPVLANEILDHALSQSPGPDFQADKRFLTTRSIVYTALGHLNEAESLVDNQMNEVSSSTRGHQLTHAFLYKGILDWLSGDRAGGIKYLEEVLEMEGGVGVTLQHAVADIVLALILDEGGAEEVLVNEQLAIARGELQSVEYRHAFGPFLVQLVGLRYRGDYSRLSKPVLTALSSLSEDEGEWLRAEAYAAMGELYHREGDFELADEMRSQSRVWQLEAMVKARAAYMDWKRVSRRTAAGSEDSTNVYLFILALLLTLLVLVLILRIRTQWMINDRLRESVEASRLAEAAAAQSSRLRRQFVSNVSHEIKTPMSGLVGMASILDELITDPEHRKYVGTIQTCSKNLLVILNDLLDLGRMESGRLDIESEPVKLADTVSYCEHVTGLEAQRKGLDVIVKVSPDVPEVIYGDSTRLQQIIVNLMNNAIKFTEKGSVQVGVDYEPVMPGSGTLRISVKDTGKGISPEHLSTVFEPFNQRQQEVDAASGNGLGLAISQKLADLMGGVISVESVVNEGSTFTLSLPIEAESSNSPA